MFVGHAAVAFVARSRHPEVSLGWWIGATFLLDLLWPLFLLIGLEWVRIAPGATAFTPFAFEHYPWSHSLLMACIWGLIFAGVARACRVPRPAAVWIGLVVVSHWVLDWVSHAPDMPLWPGVSPTFGLELWNSIAGTLVVEGALFVIGLSMYLRSTSARDWIGKLGFWSFVVLCTAIWVSQPWSPPPPSTRVLAWAGLAGFLLVLWAWWFDRHRGAAL